MSYSCVKLLCRLLYQVVLRCLLACIIVFIDRQIVKRRDLIIQWGRRTEDMLHIPRCLRVFDDTKNRAIRAAARMTFAAGFGMKVGWLVYISQPAGRWRNRTCLILIVIYPAFMTLFLVLEWLPSVPARRRLESRVAACEKVADMEVNYTEASNTEVGETGLWDSIMGFLALRYIYGFSYARLALELVLMLCVPI
ncbi:hypothetical protein QBC47DRAFT_441679 [Echria macrotheca]|uniref:Uncharacterized protein n=1 Tax=Echria macrotheca TaxID=438768 RepID=A0AAJ0B4Z1_9PEZI|nr:hypothetical protein QBC47DRAFT_441679 [Echria macrotheca]